MITKETVANWLLTYRDNDRDGVFAKDGKRDLLRYWVTDDCFSVTLLDDEYYILNWIESYGGEGQGDNCGIIFSVTSRDNVSYWKVPGFYSSDNGATYYWEQVHEVSKKLKTIEVWE